MYLAISAEAISRLPKKDFVTPKTLGHSQKMSSIDLPKTFVHLFTNLHVPTPCYKQFLPGLEEPEKSADAEKSEILR